MEAKSVLSPDSCNNCGSKTDGLVLFQKGHDVVTLCYSCSHSIRPGYRKVSRNAPIPGAMMICTDCIMREDMRCLHPRAADGPDAVGVLYDFSTTLNCRGDSNRRVYLKPPFGCSSKKRE